jgi:hypothetical protein
MTAGRPRLAARGSGAPPGHRTAGLSAWGWQWSSSWWQEVRVPGHEESVHSIAALSRARARQALLWRRPCAGWECAFITAIDSYLWLSNRVPCPLVHAESRARRKSSSFQWWLLPPPPGLSASARCLLLNVVVVECAPQGFLIITEANGTQFDLVRHAEQGGHFRIGSHA